MFLVSQIGERQRVLVTEESFDSQYYVSHNKFYEQVQATLVSFEILAKVFVNIYVFRFWLTIISLPLNCSRDSFLL